MTYQVIAEDFGSNQEVTEYGLDLAQAYNEALIKSKFGNTDFVLLLKDGMPVMKFQDGDDITESKR